ncbi:hypothetical protein FD29_GL001920 [Companilactobacillus mindensis DSM 14500]|uniref:Uncharacterized protein n=1 Tax=Companilactobacillus mindensis DSM 14500 TaxID=1423770 RepID=A0A0R1QMD0_9LACO|nr:hypothetical protein [Companilactobacillus mindensis]KRL45917.1 hypothetical protein FD29_GL001920 [Companilactobacillus mindensis DSM 14500]GEO77780.1 hypothetical protein LMI01_01110 [Companilactobacillus mindensis]
MEKIFFQKGDLNFIKNNYPDSFEDLRPIINSDMMSVNIPSDKDYEKLVEMPLIDALTDDKSLDGIELNNMGLKVEAIIDYVNLNN